jgi:hypothetical protein
MMTTGGIYRLYAIFIYTNLLRLSFFWNKVTTYLGKVHALSALAPNVLHISFRGPPSRRIASSNPLFLPRVGSPVGRRGWGFPITIVHISSLRKRYLGALRRCMSVNNASVSVRIPILMSNLAQLRKRYPGTLLRCMSVNASIRIPILMPSLV